MFASNSTQRVCMSVFKFRLTLSEFRTHLRRFHITHIPSNSSLRSALQNIITRRWRSPPRVTAAVRLTTVKTYPIYNPKSYLWALLPWINCSWSEQNPMWLWVFIPAEGLGLHPTLSSKGLGWAATLHPHLPALVTQNSANIWAENLFCVFK